MKLFLSWSGQTSRSIAKQFRKWLPMLLQHVQPYLSSADIDKGSRWSTDIANELQASNFGLIFITPDNTQAPWIMFEAGALAKAVDTSVVAPILFNVPQAQLRDSPLVQFQLTPFEREEVKSLVHLINRTATENQVPVQTLDALFDKLWPDLEAEIVAILKGHVDVAPEPKKPRDQQASAIEELVVNTRNILKRLSIQEALLAESKGGEHAIHRLERNALDRSLKQAEMLRDAIARFKGELETELDPDAIPVHPLDSLRPLVEELERDSSALAGLIARMRRRILQISED